MMRENNTKVKQKILFFLFCAVILFILVRGTDGLLNFLHYSVINDDLEPILIMDRRSESNGKDVLVLHFLQKDRLTEKIIMPDNFRIVGSQYELSNNKQEFLLLEGGYGITKYNYITGDIQRICPFSAVSEIWDNYGVGDMQFIPDSNNISFITNSKLYKWKSDEKQYEEIYDYSNEKRRLGFGYKWKNNNELYIVKDKNLILYNIDTKNEQIIQEGIGNVYFEMSEDNSYIVYQEQYGNRRKVFLMDLRTMEKKKIHVTESLRRVTIFFSPNLEYIFIKDIPRDIHFFNPVWYLYDIKDNKRIEIEEENSWEGYGEFIGW